MKYILIFLLSIQFCFADQVSSIKKDSPAPYEGVLFDVEAANNLRKDKLELTFKQKESELLNQRIDNAQKEIDRLAKENQRTEIFGLPTSFVAGILTTVLIGWTVNKVAK